MHVVGHPETSTSISTLTRPMICRPRHPVKANYSDGVPECYNSAQFLGHLPGKRGSRGPIPTGPGVL